MQNGQNEKDFETLRDIIDKNFDKKQKEVFKTCVYYIENMCNYKQNKCRQHILDKCSQIEDKIDKIIGIIGENGNA